MNYKELEQKYEFDVFPKRDLVIVRGKDAKVWDDQGNEYIDCIAGHGAANLGHCNEKVVDAINEQAKTLITCSGVLYNDKRALLLEKLIGIAPESLTRGFLCSTGTEAIEAALKFARFNAKNKKDKDGNLGNPNKIRFICAMRSFHGRTLGALSATFNPRYKEDFEPLVPGFSFVPFNNIEKLRERVEENSDENRNNLTAAIILEVVQGEGGVNIGKEEYFRQVRQLCDEKDILLIIDEVQTGFCRTGKMFASNHFNLQPDILCLAKSIAGGVPMGAVLCSDKVEVPIGRHGTTFGGNPLACAASIAAIDFMLDNNLAKQAEKKGRYFLENFTKKFDVMKTASKSICQAEETEDKSSKVREVRQIGLMIGIGLKEKSGPYIEKLISEGVLALPAGPTVLRLLPPLTISYEELDIVIDKVVKVLS
ncbi:MAG: aminotransferase class III-fold pyridoxal phosphate-dependent enzyme [Candidatus Woesearchaeota archaeon]